MLAILVDVGCIDVCYSVFVCALLDCLLVLIGLNLWFGSGVSICLCC